MFAKLLSFTDVILQLKSRKQVLTVYHLRILVYCTSFPVRDGRMFYVIKDTKGMPSIRFVKFYQLITQSCDLFEMDWLGISGQRRCWGNMQFTFDGLVLCCFCLTNICLVHMLEQAIQMVSICFFFPLRQFLKYFFSQAPVQQISWESH